VIQAVFPLAAAPSGTWTARVTVFCFLASYLLAMGLEIWRLLRPRPVFWILALAAGSAGFVAQTIYLAFQKPPLAWQSGWMLFTAWILTIFYLFGALHHARLAWGVFVLPVILGLVGLAELGRLLDPPPPGSHFSLSGWLSFQGVHALLLFLGTIGVCVGFLASVMYLIQSHRLRAKIPPGKGLKLLSLERLEAMNRRAITLAFPLLTIGMLIGGVLLFVEPAGLAHDESASARGTAWTDPRVLSALVLWLAVAVLLYLRYGLHLRGRQVAVGTIVAFGLLIGCLSLSHPVGKGPLGKPNENNGQDNAKESSIPMRGGREGGREGAPS
jgi:ABC-type transport system involved in cytochrome c biogenesis permease subunit